MTNNTLLKISTEEKVKKLSIWKNGTFITLWVCSMISKIAINFYALALPLIIYQLTKSTFAMSALRAIEILPAIVLGMVIGVYVDRLNKKNLMLASLGIQIVSIAILIILLSTDFQLLTVFLVILVFFTSNLSFQNTYESVIPLIVEKDELVQANSARSFSNTIISIIGPALAGIVLSLYSNKSTLFVTLIAYSLLFCVLWFIKIPKKKNKRETKRKKLLLEIKEGWTSLISNKVVWYMTIILLFVNIATAWSAAVLIFFSVDELHLSEDKLGILLAFQAIGGILASLSAKKIIEKTRFKRIIVLALALCTMGQALLFLSTNIIFLACAIFLMGLSFTLINIYYYSIRQRYTPPELLGRVSSTANSITMLATPIAFLIGGLVGEIIEVRYIFLGSTILMILILIHVILRNQFFSIEV